MQPHFLFKQEPLVFYTSLEKKQSVYQFKISTVEDAASLSRYAAGLFPKPSEARAGLYELLLNAIEHGCYGIGAENKARMIENKNWYVEIARRQDMPENKNKSVDVVISQRKEGIYAIITDPGGGFDYKPWQDPAKIKEALHRPVGRGLARCKTEFFQRMSYNPQGNKIAAMQFLQEVKPLF